MGLVPALNISQCKVFVLMFSFLLSTGFWRTREELRRLISTDKVFLPREAPKDGPSSLGAEYVPVFQSWERALQRSMNWYSKT